MKNFRLYVLAVFQNRIRNIPATSPQLDGRGGPLLWGLRCGVARWRSLRAFRRRKVLCSRL